MSTLARSTAPRVGAYASTYPRQQATDTVVRHRASIERVNGHANDNEELVEIYESDQADRRSLLAENAHAIRDRDHARRERVGLLLDGGAAQTGNDHFHAAMVFQHGGSLDDYAMARSLALRAAELGHRQGPWLAAAALDRSLVAQGQPQKYGTQYRPQNDAWILLPVDPATTDEERLTCGVLSLAAAIERAADMTRSRPPATTEAGLPIDSMTTLRVRRAQLVAGETLALPPDDADTTHDAAVQLGALPEGINPIVLRIDRDDGSQRFIRLVIEDDGTGNVP